MDQRSKYLEQMRDRLEAMNDNTEMRSGKKAEGKTIVIPTRNNEYITRVKTRLDAWVNELDKWKAKAYRSNSDEDYLAQIQKLDLELSEGYEKLKDLIGTTDENWDVIREESEILWEDITSTFDQVREFVGGGLVR
jgi:hypothetical protein